MKVATEAAKDLGSHSRAGLWIGQLWGGVVLWLAWARNVHHNYSNAHCLCEFGICRGVGSPLFEGHVECLQPGIIVWDDSLVCDFALVLEEFHHMRVQLWF